VTEVSTSWIDTLMHSVMGHGESFKISWRSKLRVMLRGIATNGSRMSRMLVNLMTERHQSLPQLFSGMLPHILCGACAVKLFHCVRKRFQ
jgi:hypothetical protein